MEVVGEIITTIPKAMYFSFLLIMRMLMSRFCYEHILKDDVSVVGTGSFPCIRVPKKKRMKD